MVENTNSYRERLREELLNSSLDSMFLIDREGIILEANGIAAERFGRTVPEFVGGNLFSLMAPGIAAQRMQFWSTLESSNKPVLVKDERNGRYYESIVCPHFDDQGVLYRASIVARDMTDRKILEEQLRRSQKLETVGRLTGGIAHHINNMLAVMMGNTEILELGVHGDPETIENIATLKKSISNAASLIQTLLTFSRQQKLFPAETDIGDLVEGFAEALLQVSGKTIIIDVKVADGLWRATVDGSYFNVVLHNLAINARDAMPQGGRLTIEARNVSLDDAYTSQAENVKAGDYVEISMRDTGHGLETDILENAFDPFFTTKDVGEGTGLGLSMVYGFVKQSGGTISIESAIGVGTTVKIHFPRFLEGQDPPGIS